MESSALPQPGTLSLLRKGRAAALVPSWAMSAAAVAIAAGGLLGAASGLEGSSPTMTFIQQNPVERFHLEGDAVVGAAIPGSANRVEVPGTEYTFTSTQGETIIVNRDGSTVRILRD